MQRSGYFSTVPVKRIKSIQYSILSDDDINHLAVCDVHSYKGVVDGRGEDGSLFDEHMGSTDDRVRCKTCRCSMDTGHGHFGKIHLYEPIYNINFVANAVVVLNMLCPKCFSCVLPSKYIQQLIGASCQEQRRDICRKYMNKKKKNEIIRCQNPLCAFMGFFHYSLSERTHIDINVDGAKRMFWAREAYIALKHISDEFINLFGFNHVYSRPENFIIRDLLVIPINHRQPNVMNEGVKRSENEISTLYENIIKTNNSLAESVINRSTDEIIQTKYGLVTLAVAALFSKKFASEGMFGKKKSYRSLEEQLNGKEGYIRGRMYGKRVDFCARGHITPDADLEIDQLGIPEYIAKRVTMMEKVAPLNIDRLRLVVSRGIDKYPGANRIIKRDGRKLLLRDTQSKALRMNADQLEYGDMVYRHLIDGDIVTFNRQPSLHKASILGFRVKVFRDIYTIRLPPAVCTPFNADFDGDEMNLMVQHNQTSLAEVQHLMSTLKNLSWVCNGKVFVGAIQDHVMGLYLISHHAKDKMTRYDFVLMTSMCKNARFDYILRKANSGPCVGDLLGAIFPPTFNFDGMGVKFVNGEYISGTINARVKGSIEKYFFNFYSPEIYRDYVFNLQKITAEFNSRYGFSIGIDDIIISDEKVRKAIDEQLGNLQLQNSKIIEEFADGKVIKPMTRTLAEEFELRVGNAIGDTNIKIGAILKEYHENLRLAGRENSLMQYIHSMSKGDFDNIKQIMGVVGQQLVNGKRLEPMYNDRTTPHYPKFDQSIAGRGYVFNCFSSGLNVLEYLAHQWAGRYGLISTALSTGDVGYMSRKLNKILEGVTFAHDHIPRVYGEHIVTFEANQNDPTYDTINTISDQDFIDAGLA